MKSGIKTGFLTSGIFISCFLLSQSSSAETLPNDVQRLVKQREAAIEKIDSKYRDALEELKLKYTKSGNLEVANSINHMISLLKPESGAGGLSTVEQGIIGKGDSSIRERSELSNSRLTRILRESF